VGPKKGGIFGELLKKDEWIFVGRPIAGFVIDKRRL
jgi:hypothetical protein